MKCILLPHHPSAIRAFRCLPALALAIMPFSLGCSGFSSGRINSDFSAPPPGPMQAVDAAPLVLRFLELEGPHTQPANYPGCVPGLPTTAIWGVAQQRPPIGTVEVDSSGTSARVRFEASSGPDGSRLDGAIRFTPLPDQKACLMDYEDLRFTYASGTWTYQGRKRVVYSPEGRIESIYSAADPRLTLTQQSAGSSVATLFILLDQTIYTLGPNQPQGFIFDLQMTQGAKFFRLMTEVLRWLNWSPDCNYPVSGELAVKDLSFPQANQEAAATFGPACGALAIKPLGQPAVPWPLAAWPGQ